MKWLTTMDYDVARLILSRGIALVYFIAFLNVRNQFRPLLGERGLLPVPRYLAGTTWKDSPSLFHFAYSDRLLGRVAWVGMALSLGGVVGMADSLGPAANLVWWLLMWALYLSVVNVGQAFYGFGWESLLLEAGFYAAFLGTTDVAGPVPVLWAFRWLLFRVEFGAGMIKLRGDPCWRDLTCLEYHHETQPMPNPASRWFHLLPRWVHRSEVAANHCAQLVAPFLLFLPQPLAGAGAVVMIVTQAYLMLSGNYAWLNLVTLLIGFAAIPDGWYRALGVEMADPTGPVGWLVVAVVIVAVGTLVLSYWPVRNLLSASQMMNRSFNRYHLVNTYGAFGSVTRHRREIVIEGSRVGDPGPDDWEAYEFKGKPTDPWRRPPQWAPYHLRLDWLMWFVGISPGYGRGWLDPLVDRLASADPAILGLLRHDPFGGQPPRMLRVRRVDYRFTTRREKAETGRVWATGETVELSGPFPAG